LVSFSAVNIRPFVAIAVACLFVSGFAQKPRHGRNRLIHFLSGPVRVTPPAPAAPPLRVVPNVVAHRSGFSKHSSARMSVKR